MKEIILDELAFIRLGCSEIRGTADFAHRVLGLETSFERNGEVYFRSDERLRTLSLCKGKPSDASLGVGVLDNRSLDIAIERLKDAGFEAIEADKETCADLLARRVVQTRDGSNNRINLVLGSFHHGTPFYPARDTGVCGLHNVGLRSTHLARDVEFWTVALDAQITDWVGDITYLAFDDLHHRIALYPSTRGGILYTAFEVEDLDNIMQSYYYAQDHEIDIVQGPGRQGASKQAFLHLAGPDQHIFSFVTGADVIDRARHSPRQFDLTTDGLCSWRSICDSLPELGANRANDVADLPSTARPPQLKRAAA